MENPDIVRISQDSMANIETIVGVQQARYRHARAIESLSPLSHQLEVFL
jgi:hypothetical protein